MIYRFVFTRALHPVTDGQKKSSRFLPNQFLNIHHTAFLSGKNNRFSGLQNSDGLSFIFIIVFPTLLLFFNHFKHWFKSILFITFIHQINCSRLPSTQRLDREQKIISTLMHFDESYYKPVELSWVTKKLIQIYILFTNPKYIYSWRWHNT